MKGKNLSNGHHCSPETLALGLGYDSSLSEGSIKSPIFLTSTFKFKSAEEGKRYFQLAYGLDPRKEGEENGLIYSRLNNPNLQIFEERIAAWNNTELASVFSSGMSAISTTCLALLVPGESIIATLPVYGGTYFLFTHILPKYGIKVHFVEAGSDAPTLIRKKIDEVGAVNVRLLYAETPGNPSNVLTDISAVAEISKELNKKKSERKTIVAIDNTFLGPIFQQPSKHGADITIYSATKFIGGHSDLIAGVVTGKADIIKEINVSRTILGTMATPFTGWLLIRSLETLAIRMRQQQANAKEIALLLSEHPVVNWVKYPGLLKDGSSQKTIFDKQCTGTGSLISFEVKGGEKQAFKVINSLQLFGLAVSLGGTESLVEHPMTMTHADVPPEELISIGITDGVIRLSIGIEYIEDLKQDLLNALKVIK